MVREPMGLDRACGEGDAVSDSERTVRLVREVTVRVDGDHCGAHCDALVERCGTIWGQRDGRYGCRLESQGDWFHYIATELLSPYRPIRCKACVEGEVPLDIASGSGSIRT
jgi:hypothetical protein